MSAAPAPRRFRSVLVSTDFSALADQALSYAAALVAGHGRAIVAHVADPFALSTSEYLQGSWDAKSRRRQRRHLATCRRRLAARVRRLQSRDLAVRPELLVVSQPASALLALARREAVDVICIASHGRSGLGAAFLGSVARKVVARSDRPVLVVRRPA